MTFEIRYEQLNLRLVIDHDIYQKIVLATQKHFPNEFGGVLVGSYDSNRKSAIIEDIICPEKYENSPVFFKRYPESINKKLKKIYSESNGTVYYLGEWHSHPNMAANPSTHDKESMEKLITESDLKITSPILLIIGGRKHKLYPQCYLLYEKQLLAYQSIKTEKNTKWIEKH